MNDDEPCETSTSTICSTTLSYGVDPSGTTTITRTSSYCSSILGCQATGGATITTTVATSTPSATPYVVYPILSTDDTATNSIQQDINNLGVPNVYRSMSPNLGTMFWFIPSLTPAQVQTLQNNANVSCSIKFQSTAS
jgi:hypothetical protein